MRSEPFEPEQAGPVEQASAWCLRLSEGGLTRVEQDRFDAWLEADEHHRRAFDDAIRAWRAVEQAGSRPELVSMRAAALTTFRRGQRARWASRLMQSRWRALAATLVLAVVATAAAMWVQQSPRAYQTAVGERRVIVLSDGSRMSLDAATKVEVRYLRSRRELRLDYGRAKFTVARNPRRPFTVAAADKVVLATGTAFSVELLGGQVQVILYQGHVAVLERPAGHGAAEHVVLADTVAPADQALTPGRELVVPVAARQGQSQGGQSQGGQVLAVDPVRTLSWEGGQLVFVDEPLASAVERVNRYSDEKVVVGDAAAGRVLISGVFTAGDTPAFIEGVTGVFPVQVRDDNGRKVLVSSRG